jgi:hypothetical protein
VSGRHTGLSTTDRRSLVLISGATVLGLWFGLRAPDVTPVALPLAVVQVQPADEAAVTPDAPDVTPDAPDVTPVAPDVTPVTPVVPQRADGRGGRGGDR